MGERKKWRLNDKKRWATNVTTICKLLIEQDNIASKEDIDLQDPNICKMSVPRSSIDKMVQNEEAVTALGELDIEEDDLPRLSDMLDPTNDGWIHLVDLVDGLRKLRGEPRRSDIVTMDLVIRAIQTDLRAIKTNRPGAEALPASTE